MEDIRLADDGSEFIPGHADLNILAIRQVHRSPFLALAIGSRMHSRVSLLDLARRVQSDDEDDQGGHRNIGPGSHLGTVRLGSEPWTAIADDDRLIEAGERIKVTGLEGLTLRVSRTKEAEV